MRTRCGSDERRFTASDRLRYEQMRTLCRFIDTGYLQLELDPQFIQMTMNLLVDY